MHELTPAEDKHGLLVMQSQKACLQVCLRQVLAIGYDLGALPFDAVILLLLFRDQRTCPGLRNGIAHFTYSPL